MDEGDDIEPSALRRQVSQEFDAEYRGYRAKFLPIANEIVAAYFDASGRADSESLIELESEAVLCRQPYQLLADAMCHAANAGVPVDDMQEMVKNLSRLVTRSPIEYASNVHIVGLHIDAHPSVSYVLAVEGDDENVLVVRPDYRTKPMTRDQLRAACQSRH